MTQEKFKEILDKYLKGTASLQENELIENWYKNLNEGSLFMPTEDQQLENKILRNLYRRIQAKKPLMSKQHRAARPWQLAIASVVVLVIASITYFVFWIDLSIPMAAESESFKEKDLFEVKNTSASVMQVSLPDGSIIALQKGSCVAYDASFTGSKREVYLEGEAFFDIHRDVHRPFFVYAHEVVTEVLGTSFIVTSNLNDNLVTVKVKTGKVLVYKSTPSANPKYLEANTLTPNQQITYDRSSRRLSRSLVDQPEAVVPLEVVQRIRFEEAPVTEIWRALEEIYGLKIEYDAQVFSECTLTTSISEGGMYNRLDIICDAIGATYTIEENQIQIMGAGCN
jgi:ferric-dicitrate binding protein FerR (iron transport regulator)